MAVCAPAIVSASHRLVSRCSLTRGTEYRLSPAARAANTTS